MKRVIGILAVLVLAAGIVQAQETKYSTSTTAVSPAVTFAAQNGRQAVVMLNTSCDKTLGAVTIYAKDSKYIPTANATNGATVILITNTGGAVTTNDVVVYQHANGTVDQTTIASCTTTSVTLTAGITVAGATGDRLYKLATKNKITVADNTAAAGTNKLATFSGKIFCAPGDSPIHVTMDSSTNSCLSVTVE